MQESFYSDVPMHPFRMVNLNCVMHVYVCLLMFSCIIIFIIFIIIIIILVLILSCGANLASKKIHKHMPLEKLQVKCPPHD